MPPNEGDKNGSETPHSFRYSKEENDQPAIAIAEAVAWVKGVDAADLEPLSRTIDTDALNELFGEGSESTDFYRSSGTPERDGVRFVFEYEGCIVKILGTGRFTIDPQ